MSTFKERYQQIYDAYLKQDYKNNIFDVIFYVDGRELYAHGHILASASDVFKKQILQNRSKRNEPIQIDDFAYDEFFVFLSLIYCFDELEVNEYDKTKIFAIIELADIYGADQIKENTGRQLTECGGFVVAQNEEELDDEDIKDIFERIEFAHKFSLLKDLRNMEKFLDKYFDDLIEFDGFNNLNESTVKAFVSYVVKNGGYTDQLDELCKAIYKWGEYQAMITVQMPKEEKKELVLHYIKDILPLFKYNKMSPKFLLKFAVPRGLISIEQANIYGRIEVSITCKNKTTITGTFVDCYAIFKEIYFRQEKDENELVHCGEKKRCFWDYTFKIPSTPSTVEKMKGCEWYLAIDINGKLNLKHQSLIKRTDYLIAEMKSENGAAFALGKDSYAYASVCRI